MRHATRFVIGLLLGLALLTLVTTIIVQKTTRDWFEKDVDLRAQLVVGGARKELSEHWRKSQSEELRSTLDEVTRDERIMAAAACNADLSLLASTADFPTQFSCTQIGAHVRPDANSPLDQWASWNQVDTLPGGPVLISAIPVINDGQPLGFVILEHDLSYAVRRESRTELFVLIAFGSIALIASGITMLVAQLSWRSWKQEIRRIARGEAPKQPEFRPILRDVQELVDRMMVEKETEMEGGAWTPQRLKLTLNRHLQGEKVVIVANREPYVHEREPDGSIRVVHPASGLVTALEPVMRACSGVWVAHGGGSADHETADKFGRLPVPPGEESYLVRRVWLTTEEERGYYYGFSNEGIWPLCHIAHARPVFRSADWRDYQIVNQKFADAVCEEVDSDDPIILVQDYHLALVPALIRERLPRATVIMFWHIPWPNSERLGICPWRRELLQGMLGSSIVGFHTQSHCNNFLDSVDRFLEARIDREKNAVVQQGHPTLVRPYPISVEWPVHWLLTTPPPKSVEPAFLRNLG